MGPARTATPHLFSCVTAVGVAAAILSAGRLIAIHLEQKALHAVAPRVFSLKNQGLAFQRAAARARDVLPLYGSSELHLTAKGWMVYDRVLDNFFHGRVPRG